MIENDIVLRQPIEPGSLADAHVDLLLRFPPIGLVPFGCARRRNNGMRARTNVNINSKPIPTRDPTRRMHDHRMTDTVTFGIKRPLNSQRPIMQPMLERGPLTILDESKCKTRAPLRMSAGLRGSERDVIFVKRHAN